MTFAIPVAEIFGPTIAGEGIDAGRRTHFLRLGGCDMLPSGACSWCDSMHAVTPEVVRQLPRMTEDEMLTAIVAFDPPTKTLTITGGNPVLYDLSELCSELRRREWILWVETQGTIYRSWLENCNVTVSPKPPSAGICDIERLEAFMANRLDSITGWETVIKIPVDPGFQDGADFTFAEMIFERFAKAERGADLEPIAPNFCLSVVTYPSDSVQDVIDRWRAVVDWAMTADIPDIRALPQLHTLLWPHEQGK